MRVERLLGGGSGSLINEGADISTAGCSDGGDGEVARRADRNMRNMTPTHQSRGARGSPWSGR